jgi:hypothetical protein
MHFLKIRFAILPAILALLSLSALGQVTSGSLTGTVYDASGATVPDATVLATNTATGVPSTTTTTSSGQYRFPNLQVGSYSLSVEATGFTKTELKDINVDLSKTATINVTLQVGQTSSTVEVSASATTIDTTTAQIQSSFESRAVQDLPSTSSGSGVINLSLLSPGVASSGSIGVGTGPSVGGQRPRNNNFTIEGIDNNSKSVTGPLVTIPNDAVSEFTALQNQFSPEFGHSTGGQFNQVVLSGSNEFHGRLYEYLQNRNMNAADQQSVVSGTPLHPGFDENRFGGQIGGPIKKNKLFFFANVEQDRYRADVIPGAVYAPTAAGYDALATVPGLSSTNLGVLKQYLGAAASATAPGDLPNGEPVTVGGVQIPIGLLTLTDARHQNILSAVGSLDYTISDKDSLRGRYITNRWTYQDYNGYPPQFWVDAPQNYYLATVSEFHNFSPNLINELRVGYNRQLQTYPPGPQTFPGLTVFPNIYIYELNLDLGPDDNAPQFTIQNNYQVTDNLSWMKGNHSIKVGYDFRKLISPQSFTQRARGEYDWSTLELYLQDQVPDQFLERTTGQVTYYGDQIANGAYFNDNWKIRPNLTLNIGLRYEYTTVPYSERLQPLNSISDVPGLITFGEPKPQKDAFMPRIGFAYSPGTSGQTSIRGGFGIGYDQLFDNLGILSLPPQLLVTVDSTPLASNFLANGAIPDTASAGPLDQATARALTSGYIPNQRLPKSIQWNFGIQHVFAQNYTLDVRYLGTRGINLPVQTRLNALSVVTPTNSLPTYLTQPSQGTLDALPLTLSQLQGQEGYVPAYDAAGFNGSYITAYMPIGNSVYHGLATQLTRRFTNGLNFVASYTWSHNIDDSTAEVFSTVTTPRRPQDFQNMRAERADSALDHRQRATLALVYDMPYFRSSQNWFMKNLVGNWEVAPIYTYQTGTWGTLQSVTDSNMNGDNAPDRVIVNPAGNNSIGSGVSPLLNSASETVAYLADNPNAGYIRAGQGAYPNAARNTYRFPPINNFDLTLKKSFNFTERLRLELLGQASNLFNHPQYTGGFLNDVSPVYPQGFTSTQIRNFLNPANSTFNQPSQVFSSNPRSLIVAAKFIF